MQTIREVVQNAQNTHASATALEFGEEHLTYEQLATQVKQLASQLYQQDIQPNEVVAFLFENTFFAIIGFLALAWLGKEVIPLDPEISAHELEMLRQQITFTKIVGCSPKLAQLSRTFSHEDCVFLDLNSLPSVSSAMVIPEPPIASESIFLYHFTSGSTGSPKAALHSQQNLINGGLIYQQTYAITENDTFFVPIPLHHSFGMIAGLITSLLSGSRLVLHGRFIPGQVIEIMGTKRVTILLATPMIYDITARCALRHTPDLSHLRLCLSSGSPLPVETASRFKQRYGIRVYSVYGCTEVGVIASRWNDQQNWPEQAIGQPMKGVQVRIINEQGNDVSPDETGLLLVKTPAMFMGYYNHIDATRAAFQDGWYITGDLAFQNKQGFLYLIGRKDTFINVGGKKVNPTEVEETLLAHPAVKEAIVYGKNTHSSSEIVHASVTLKSDVSIDELITFCRQRLAAYKVPGHVNILTELSRTSLDKIRRADYTKAN